ncbi:glycosyl transferase [Aphanothece sacrum FPU1]|uniref:Glycosyl transferase n=2 Tax=Aphanothece sacrum TaxID=1122 RepID=A0A401IF77_APHSA|nr:glycosyl transferase [Aphanothece sacrum FPU1]
MHQALMSKKEFELVNLGDPYPPSQWNNIKEKIKKTWGSFQDTEKQKKENNENFAKLIKKQLEQNNFDVIFAPVASKELPFLETDLPIIYLSDTTPRLILQTYGKKILLDEEEKQQIVRASKIVYSSKWAANSAINDYEADPNKIEIVPFGANIEQVPEIDKILTKCQSSACRLLFIGKDWQRKGGKIAWETLLSLLKLNLEVELVILGCIPPPEFQHEKFKIIPFLDKNIPQEQEQFIELLLSSHFLIFPTRADCSPIVICEANAYGIPVMTTDVGGIPDIIENGKNGFMLSLNDSGDQYANLIATYFSDKNIYEQLVRSSREEYEKRLNWDQWANSVYRIASELVSN